MTQMSEVSVVVKDDFLASMAYTRPLVALSELIWNGFDARSGKVSVDIDYNELKVMESIRVCDFGEGIVHGRIEEYFGSLGESWKKKVQRYGDRVLHGKHGRGRFRAFALGHNVQWVTTYAENGNFYTYTISGTYPFLKKFAITSPEQATIASCGTEVKISSLPKNFRSLDNESTPFELAKIFALYLAEYPHLRLYINNARIDPELVQDRKSDYKLSPFIRPDGKKVGVELTIIEWKTATERKIYLCDTKGTMLCEIEDKPNIQAKGFHFTIYVKSEYFTELDKSNSLDLVEMVPELKAVMDQVIETTKSHFRERKLEGTSHLIETWKAEEIYPYEDKLDIDPIETVERQVFNILAVNVQDYLPKFDSAEPNLKKFIFLLLNQALQKNPESLQKIITDVLNLNKEKQDEFAQLLEKTSLSSVISAGKIVTDRLEFLTGLSSLLFNRNTKKTFTEKSQLHKMLETEAWIFKEDFFLAGSEVWLEEALEEHLDILRPEEKKKKGTKKTGDQILTSDGKRGRLDLLCRSRVPKAGEYDYLVVELKRPNKKIDGHVLSQIEKYAMAVSRDARFANKRSQWNFIAVSNEMDEYAKMRATQPDRPEGLIISQENFSVWAYEWSEVIANARARLEFFRKQLDYNVTKESSQEYLKKAYANYLPKLEGKRPEDEIASDEDDVDDDDLSDNLENPANP
ncbi:ATP-binding protein [Deltaproteobacteria bacterium Smac51]|nr:ATP-binding protein [Deltaproteobacteria bacterium Smac51]